jgi:hypothetical protein
LGRKLARDIQSRRQYPLQHLIGRGVNCFILRPNFRAAILDHQEGIMKGVYESLRQRELLPAQ